jgi:hypothetical protein
LTESVNGNIDSTTHDVTWSAFEYDVRDMIDKITNVVSPTAGNQQIGTFTSTDRGQPLKQVEPNGTTVDYAYYLNDAVKSHLEKKSDGTTVVARHELEYHLNGNTPGPPDREDRRVCDHLHGPQPGPEGDRVAVRHGEEVHVVHV